MKNNTHSIKVIVLSSLLLVAQLSFGQQPVVTLNDHLTAEQVGQALQAYPPSIANADARSQIAQSLDKLVHISTSEKMSNEQAAELAPLRDLYLQQVDKGLDALEQCTVTTGVRIFKFYSSSVIIKSSTGTIAIDFQQGPHVTYCGNINTPDPVATKTGFHWSSRQLDRLAKLVDISLITHAHSDHADYELSRRLTALGKTVILTQQLKDLWHNLGKNLVVPDYGTIQQFGPVEIDAMKGCQYMENDKITKDSTGEATGYPSTNPRITDAVTNVYLFRIGGLVFLQGAENNVPGEQWLRDGIAKGLRPDVKMSVGARQGARSMGEVLKETPVFFLPIHEYEMGHPGGGNRTAPLYMGNRGNAIKKGLEMPLFWGENYALDATMFSGHKQ